MDVIWYNAGSRGRSESVSNVHLSVVITLTCSLAGREDRAAAPAISQTSISSEAESNICIIPQGMVCITKVIPYFNWR